MTDDSGEFSAASCQLGLPHPPGYPLLCLLDRIFTLLPIGTPAFRLNLLSQLFGVGALLVSIKLLRRILPQTESSPGLTLFLAWLGMAFLGCRDLLSQSLTAKGCVYTLTLLFTAWLLILYWDRMAVKRGLRMMLPFFVWALGMSNHWQTHLVWLPFLGVWFYQTRAQWGMKELARGFTIALIGLSPYLYLSLRGNLHPLPCWGDPNHWRGFNWIVTRKLVSGLEPFTRDLDFYLSYLSQLKLIYTTHWLPGFVLGVLPGVYFLGKKERDWLRGLLVLGISVFLAVGVIHEENNTFLVPLYLLSLSSLVWLVAGYGWWVLFGRIQKGRIGIILLLLAIQSFWTAKAMGLEDKSRYALAGDFADNVLLGLPQNAVLIGEGDHYVMGIWDAIYARGERPDVTFEPGVFLVHDWGWRQIAQQDRDWSAISQSPLFQERLETLTSQPLRHPLYYSLDNNKMRLALVAVRGRWVREGLAMRWIEIQKGKRVEPSSAQTRRLYSLQRFRWKAGDENAWDPSSQVILAYYRGEGSKNPKE